MSKSSNSVLSRRIASTLRQAGILTLASKRARASFAPNPGPGRTTAYVHDNFVSSFSGFYGAGHKSLKALRAADEICVALVNKGLSPWTPITIEPNIHGKLFINYPSGGFYVA